MSPSSSSVARVSVITVVKNGERYLAEALQSILNQTLPPCEIILVDGQSTDRTAEIARSFAGLRYLCQQDQGLANARNLGIAAAQGELVAFLDHDDLWPPEKLDTQVRYMLERPELGYTTTLTANGNKQEASGDLRILGSITYQKIENGQPTAAEVAIAALKESLKLEPSDVSAAPVYERELEVVV